MTAMTTAAPRMSPTNDCTIADRHRSSGRATMTNTCYSFPSVHSTCRRLRCSRLFFSLFLLATEPSLQLLAQCLRAAAAVAGKPAADSAHASTYATGPPRGRY